MIFVDIDGVLADFVTAAFSVHGKVFDPETYPRKEWSIANVLGISDREFWRRIDFAGEAFWENLDLFPHSLEMLEMLSRYDEICFATSPSSSPASYSGKRRWLQKMGFDLIPAMFGSKKHLMSGPGRILIDDSPKNCEQWYKSGGTAILFKQVWNTDEKVDDKTWRSIFDEMHAKDPMKPNHIRYS